MWVDNVQIAAVTEIMYKSRKETNRALFKIILDNDSLTKMSPTGKGKHEAMPENIYYAVKSNYALFNVWNVAGNIANIMPASL